MPLVFTFGRYLLFFWTGEDSEPVHIHVTVKRPEKTLPSFGRFPMVAANSRTMRAKSLQKT